MAVSGESVAVFTEALDRINRAAARTDYFGRVDGISSSQSLRRMLTLCLVF